MLKRLWRDEGGAVLSVELILLLVILVIGLVAGMTALRDSVDLKFAEVASAVGHTNPSYKVGGIQLGTITACNGTLTGGAGVPLFGFLDSMTVGTAPDTMFVLTDTLTITL